MADLATVDDVESLWRKLTPEEDGQAEALLRMASTIVRSSVSTVDVRVADGTLDRQVVADVVASMVVRALRNPTGVKQETIGPVSYSVDSRVAAGYLFLDPFEAAILAPAGLPGARGFGTIRLDAGLA